MSVESRNNVRVTGSGPATIVFIHGFGCDQSMWRYLVPAFVDRFRVITFDLVGSGGSDRAAYDRRKYGTLHGYADDLLEIIDACAEGRVVLIGHSVGAMIGLLATIKAPTCFGAQVLVGPSPCFINDGDYVGGFNLNDMDVLLQMMEENFVSWSKKMTPMIMGAPDRPDLGEVLTETFLHNDPSIARHFARVTFLSDHRADLPRSSVPALLLECTDDLLVPREVGQYMHRHLPQSTLRLVDNVGHCPHLSAPTASFRHIDSFLTRTLR